MRKLITNFKSLFRDNEINKLSEVARQIGISRPTLYALFDDSWMQIQRDTIEKVCRYFNCNISNVKPSVHGLIHLFHTPLLAFV